MENMQNMQDVQYVQLSVKVPAELHALVRSAAFKKEVSLAEFVRQTLKEAAEFYVESA